MSKKGIIQLFLGLGAVAVWGLVVMRLFNNSTEQDLAVSVKPNLIRINPHADSIEYQLDLNYEDPFLKNDIKKKVNFENSIKQKNKTITQKKVESPKQDSQEFIWPEIKYKGLLENKKTGLKSALVFYNGREDILRIGQILDDCHVHEISSLRIVLRNLKGEENIYLKLQ